MKRKSETTLGDKVIGFFIAWPLCGLLFMWYNHVWFQWDIPWWKWFLLFLPFFVVKDITAVKWLFTFVSTVAIVVQFCAWLNLVNLPLVK